METVTNEMKVIKIDNFYNDLWRLMFVEGDPEVVVVPPNNEKPFDYLEGGLRTTKSRIMEILDGWRNFRKTGEIPIVAPKERVALYHLERLSFLEAISDSSEYIWVTQGEYYKTGGKEKIDENDRDCLIRAFLIKKYK